MFVKDKVKRLLGRDFISELHDSVASFLESYPPYGGEGFLRVLDLAKPSVEDSIAKSTFQTFCHKIDKLRVNSEYRSKVIQFIQMARENTESELLISLSTSSAEKGRAALRNLFVALNLAFDAETTDSPDKGMCQLRVIRSADVRSNRPESVLHQILMTVGFGNESAINGQDKIFFSRNAMNAFGASMESDDHDIIRTFSHVDRNQLTLGLRSLVDLLQDSKVNGSSITCAIQVVGDDVHSDYFRCSKLADSQFDLYTPTNQKHNQSPIVVVSEEIYHLLFHRFTFEALGELEGSSDSNRLRPVAYRVWSPIETQDDPIVPVIVEQALRSIGRAIEVPVPGNSSGCVERVHGVAHELIWRLEEESDQSVRIIHWQCVPGRQFDLLRPIDEWLGHFIGLNRRNTFRANGKDSIRPIDVSSVVDAFLQNSVGETSAVVIRDMIISLLVGSRGPSTFSGVASGILDLVKSLCSTPTRIVIEGLEYADELTGRLARDLPRVIPGDHDFKLFFVQAGVRPLYDRPKSPLKLINDRTGDSAALLSLASVLGFEFQLNWLQETWIAQNCRPNSGSVDDGSVLTRYYVALEKCLRHGILQYCDPLIDGTHANICLPQIKWVHHYDYEYYLAECYENEKSGVQKAFWDYLRGNNCVPQVAELRLRCRIFDILQTSHEQDPAFVSFLAELGKFLGDRAKSAGAFDEARRRYFKAIELLSYPSLSRSLDFELALESVFLWTIQRDTPQTREELDFNFAQQLLDLLEDFSDEELEGLDKAKWFGLARVTWAAQIWDGDLATALRNVQLLSRLSRGDRNLDAETSHVASVTYFARGELNLCLEIAQKGVQYCEEARSQPRNESFGQSHDGRVCCKIFCGLADLLLHGLDSRDLMSQAVAFAKREHSNAETQRIAFSYLAIKHLLVEEYAKIEEQCIQCQSLNQKHQQWTIFTQLIANCGDIALCFYSGNLPAELLDDFEEYRRRWGVREYDTLWLPFLGIAKSLTGRLQSEVDESFDAAVALANDRNEYIFMPFVFLWWGRVLTRCGDKLAAEPKWREGLAIATRMRSYHYERLLTNALSDNSFT